MSSSDDPFGRKRVKSLHFDMLVLRDFAQEESSERFPPLQPPRGKAILSHFEQQEEASTACPEVRWSEAGRALNPPTKISI